MDATSPQRDDFSDAPLPNPRRSGFRTALIATAAVVALGAGASAYSLGSYLSGGGAQPDDILRSGAIAFAKVDLDPAANQKLAVYQLSKKFPALIKDAGGEGAIRDTLLKQLLDDASADQSYDRDVKPWLGDRAGVAVYPPAAGSKTPRFALAAQYTDEAEMLASVTKDAKADEKFDWATRDGYVIGTWEAEADDLVAPNGAQSLASQSDFTSDVAALDGDQLAVAWADMGALVDLGVDAAMAEFDSGKTPAGIDPTMQQQIAGMQKQDAAQMAKMAEIGGRISMGIRAGADYLEMQGKMFGLTGAEAMSNTPGTDLAGQMPADSLAALSAAGISKNLAEQWKGLDALNPMMAPMVEGMLADLGLVLPADFSALFGDETAVSIGAAGPQDPQLVLRTRGGDLDRAKVLATMLTTALKLDAPAAKKLADGFVLGNDAELVEAAGTGARLADTESYERAVPDADHAAVVLYANIARTMAALEAPAADVEKAGNLDSLGFTATSDEDPTFRLRLTTK